MATRLVMTFDTASGTTTFNYNYVDPEVTAVAVRALATGIISNGSIFAAVPLTAKSAKLVTTSESDIELSA